MVSKKSSQILFFAFLLLLINSCELFTPITAESTVRYRSDRKVSASTSISTSASLKPPVRRTPPPPPPARTRTSKETVSSKKRSTSTPTRKDRLRTDIISYAKQFVGTKYVYAGKDPRGFDCSGFTSYVMKEFDVSLSSSSRMQEDQGRSISVSDALAGDLIFFRREKRGRVFHVALVVSNTREGLKVIHSTNRGVVVDNISHNSYWKPKISTARRVI